MKKKRKQRITMELILTEEDNNKAITYALENAKELYESGRLQIKIESVGREQLLREIIADVMSHG
ncbi:hypothetical protein CN918_30425 [Priestia megaterium]|nr:hypothetical protein CN918_30425 [Priestia megaterium]